MQAQWDVCPSRTSFPSRKTGNTYYMPSTGSGNNKVSSSHLLLLLDIGRHTYLPYCIRSETLLRIDARSNVSHPWHNYYNYTCFRRKLRPTCSISHCIVFIFPPSYTCLYNRMHINPETLCCFLRTLMACMFWHYSPADIIANKTKSGSFVLLFHCPS